MTSLEESLLTDIGFTEALDWRVSPQGDVAVVSGVANLNARLLRRLLTVPGTVITLPDFGVGLKRFQNAPLTFSVQRFLATLIREQFEQDPGVSKVTRVSMTQDAVSFSRITVAVSVDVVGAGPVDLQFEPIGD